LSHQVIKFAAAFPPLCRFMPLCYIFIKIVEISPTKNPASCRRVSFSLKNNKESRSVSAKLIPQIVEKISRAGSSPTQTITKKFNTAFAIP
jgi:hypothetical protein